MRFYRKPAQKNNRELTSGVQTSAGMSSAPSNPVVKGVRVRTNPGTRSRRTLITMSPEALKLMMYKWYVLGFGDTGRGFNGDTIPPTNKALRSILGARFDRAYRTREDDEQ